MSPLALYIHWPFCKAKCPYCDFNSHVRTQVDHQAWEEALLEELDYAAQHVSPDLTLVSIFFGGGTPSLMPPRTVEALIACARALFSVHEPIEITLEANPTSAEAAAFTGFRAAGVNRLSLGIQSLRAADLAFLGRQHNVEEAKEALILAKEIFPRFSFDLIYTRPGQTLADWQEELEEALAMVGEHLSLYQLTIEPETPFERFYQAGDFRLPDEETAAAMYEYTLERCANAGLVRYEVSNFARVGQESRHNLAYWRGEAYLGIGPGAHGRYQSKSDGAWIATSTLRSPERWLSQVARVGHGQEVARRLPARERAEEIILTALRLKEGLSKSSLYEATGLTLDDLSPATTRHRLGQHGLMEESELHLRVTPQGMTLLDHLLGELLAEPNA